MPAAVEERGSRRPSGKGGGRLLQRAHRQRRARRACPLQPNQRRRADGGQLLEDLRVLGAETFAGSGGDDRDGAKEEPVVQQRSRHTVDTAVLSLVLAQDDGAAPLRRLKACGVAERYAGVTAVGGDGAAHRNQGALVPVPTAEHPRCASDQNH